LKTGFLGNAHAGGVTLIEKVKQVPFWSTSALWSATRKREDRRMRQPLRPPEGGLYMGSKDSLRYTYKTGWRGPQASVTAAVQRSCYAQVAKKVILLLR